jgi:two-component system LytT family sensor kinase
MTTIDLSDGPAGRVWWRRLLVWTGAMVIYAVVLWRQVGLPPAVSLAESALYLYSLMLLMIPVAALSHRWLARGLTTISLVARHSITALITVTVWRALILVSDRINVGPQFWQIIYARNWMFQVLFDIAMYGAAIGLTLASQLRRRDQDRERREAALILAAREAELGTIRAQFQPHVVLNALNSLLALIDREPALARTMVVRLADLMKAVFDRQDAATVPLERELDLARAYLDIERIRFGPRLSVAFEIDDAARGVMVPPFLLQPLVENAVKHGVAPFTRPGVVRVRAGVRNERLEIRIEDSGRSVTGVDVDAPTSAGTGRGLSLTRRRLHTLYGQGYELTLDRGPAGTVVCVQLPAHAA